MRQREADAGATGSTMTCHGTPSKPPSWPRLYDFHKAAAVAKAAGRPRSQCRGQGRGWGCRRSARRPPDRRPTGAALGVALPREGPEARAVLKATAKGCVLPRGARAVVIIPGRPSIASRLSVFVLPGRLFVVASPRQLFVVAGRWCSLRMRRPAGLRWSRPTIARGQGRRRGRRRRRRMGERRG